MLLLCDMFPAVSPLEILHEWTPAMVRVLLANIPLYRAKQRSARSGSGSRVNLFTAAQKLEAANG